MYGNGHTMHTVPTALAVELAAAAMATKAQFRIVATAVLPALTTMQAFVLGFT